MSPASSARIFSSFLSSSSSTTGPPAMFYCLRASAAAGAAGAFLVERPLLATLNTEARAPPPPARSGRWALPSHRNKTLRHIHGCGLVDALASLKGKPQSVSPMPTPPRWPLALDAG